MVKDYLLKKELSRGFYGLLSLGNIVYYIYLGGL